MLKDLNLEILTCVFSPFCSSIRTFLVGILPIFAWGEVMIFISESNVCLAHIPLHEVIKYVSELLLLTIKDK